MVADAQSVVRSQIGVVDRGYARRTGGGRYMNAGYRADGGSAHAGRTAGSVLVAAARAGSTCGQGSRLERVERMNGVLA
jgi:hypothetical protein